MAIKATINTGFGNRVSVNIPQRQSIRTVNISPDVTAKAALADLTDVNASSPDNNDVLVYESSSNKYVIKELPALNGGTF
jgi:hypothetical protein